MVEGKTKYVSDKWLALDIFYCLRFLQSFSGIDVVSLKWRSVIIYPRASAFSFLGMLAQQMDGSTSYCYVCMSNYIFTLTNCNAFGTLKAIAGEAGVPFFYRACSEFEEMRVIFLGMLYNFNIVLCFNSLSCEGQHIAAKLI